MSTFPGGFSDPVKIDLSQGHTKYFRHIRMSALDIGWAKDEILAVKRTLFIDS